MLPSQAVQLILKEFREATATHDKFNSPQEGWYVLFEEVWELFDEVRKCKSFNHRHPGLKREAIQVAAMALRFIVDCTEVDETVI